MTPAYFDGREDFEEHKCALCWFYKILSSQASPTHARVFSLRPLFRLKAQVPGILSISVIIGLVILYATPYSAGSNASCIPNHRKPSQCNWPVPLCIIVFDSQRIAGSAYCAPASYPTTDCIAKSPAGVGSCSGPYASLCRLTTSCMTPARAAAPVTLAAKVVEISVIICILTSQEPEGGEEM